MRVLILSCNTGEGHNACGKALVESLREREITCQMSDAFSFISPNISQFVSSGFNLIYRHLPDMFRSGYQYTENHPNIFEGRSKIYQFLTSGAERLYAFILQENFDTVICTHVFSALMVTEVMRQHNRFLRTYFVATDYTCSPSCGQSDLDAYFIPDASLSCEFIRCGLQNKKLIPSGIPIRKEFYHSLTKSEAKRRLGLEPDIPHLLIMCGSMGCGPIREIVRTVVKSMDKAYYMTVICGTNRRLHTQLSRAYAGNPCVKVRGFVQNIAGLMDSADLFLTKPGGLSITEAAQKRLPMAFVDAVAGCEAYNMRYFTAKGVALTAGTLKTLAQLTCAILSDPELLIALAKNYQNIPENTAAKMIADFVVTHSMKQRR